MSGSNPPWGTAYFSALNSIVFSNTNTKIYPSNGILAVLSMVGSGSAPSTVIAATTPPGFPSIDAGNSADLINISTYIDVLNLEYKFYYDIYKNALKSLLDDILYLQKNSSVASSGCPSTGPAPDLSLINISLEQQYVVYMNVRCLQLLQYMLYINNMIKSSSNSLINTIAINSESITAANINIQDQNILLQKQNMSVDVYKKMLDYTYEKNKYSSNLLALYGGLNIIAISLLIYIYRS
jgi:hypothetical protein